MAARAIQNNRIGTGKPVDGVCNDGPATAVIAHPDLSRQKV